MALSKTSVEHAIAIFQSDNWLNNNKFNNVTRYMKYDNENYTRCVFTVSILDNYKVNTIETFKIFGQNRNTDFLKDILSEGNFDKAINTINDKFGLGLIISQQILNTIYFSIVSNVKTFNAFKKIYKNFYKIYQTNKNYKLDTTHKQFISHLAWLSVNIDWADTDPLTANEIRIIGDKGIMINSITEIINNDVSLFDNKLWEAFTKSQLQDYDTFEEGLQCDLYIFEKYSEILQ